MFRVNATGIHFLNIPGDTIKKLNNFTGAAVYKAPNGKTYNVSFDDDQSAIEVENNVPADEHGIAAARANNTACDHGNKFDGVYRKTAKLSVSSKQSATATLPALITRVKKVSKSSLNGITKSSLRISSEDANFSVQAFLYAITRESDEDYHIIIGTSNDPSTAEFFNVECAGLPANSSAFFAKLQTVRNKVVSFLGGTEVCKSGYIKFHDHPKIQVSGSLFYDKEHENSIVGPTDSKPKTAWELHPITAFKVF